ncbi:MAG: selenocysteine-specific translation elongation factor [Acidobacteriota bacterium]
MRRVVVGTAGHVDHGKTRLVEALTGIDCDRWAEEKERGITIDLGFAHLRDQGPGEGDLQVGFVDVPGHQRFLHNALAGMGGIRLLLLVVAADEGVMPQTREHVAICSLLGIPAALVVLTKADLASEDVLELAELEVEELLESTPFAGAPVHRVSSLTGDGVEELRLAILLLGRRHAVEPPAEDAPARLPVDRAFLLTGLGVVVTGTLTSGRIQPGDTLETLPGGLSARVRGIQVHGEGREEAVAGERTSLQLTGVGLEKVPRGTQLATPETFESTRSLVARFTLLADAPAPLDGTMPVRIHLYAQEVVGRMRPLEPRTLQPGEAGIVELRLAAPVAAIRGDRFIARRPSPAATLGGGMILDPQWRRRRRAEMLATLEGLAGNHRNALLAWVAGERERGIETDRLARRLGQPAVAVTEDLRGMAAEGRLLEVVGTGGRESAWLDPGCLDRAEERARRVLDTYFARDPMARGLPKAEALKRILPGVAPTVAAFLLDRLDKRGVLTAAGGLILQPGREVTLEGDAKALADSLVEFLNRGKGPAPENPALVASALEAEDSPFETALRFLLDEGTVVRLPGGMIHTAAALNDLRQDLVASGWERFSVPQFKERYGLSRKTALPLLEHLDSIGVTRRVGDERQLVGR